MTTTPTNSEFQWLSEEEQRAWRAYLRGSAKLTEVVGRDLFTEHRITHNKYEVLVRLSEAPDHTVRMSDLADGLVHSRSRLTRTVASLEEDGYVQRESCSADRRGRNCRLTDKGYALLEEIAPDHVASVRARILDKVGHDNFIELGRIMAMLAED